MPAPIRIGLAGYGLGGRYFHAPLLASAPDCEFLGVVTTSPERRRQVAAPFGSHLADQALVLAGPVSGVYAEMHYRSEPGGLDDDFFIALTHEGGVRSHLWGSWRQGAPGPRLRAAGTSGSYLIADADGQEARLRSGAITSAAGQRWGAEPPERWGHLLRGDTAEPVPSARGAWDLFYPAFAAAIRAPNQCR